MTISNTYLLILGTNEQMKKISNTVYLWIVALGNFDLCKF